MDEHEIERVRRVEADYDDAWGRGDVEGILELVAPDAVLVNPRGEEARGPAAVRAHLTGFLLGEAAGSTHHGHLDRVELVTDDVAVVDGRARLAGLTPGVAGADESGVIVHGFTDVLVRRGDRWLIAQVRTYPAGG